MGGGTKGRRSIQAWRMSEKRHLLQVHRRSSRTQSSTPQHVPVPYTTLVKSTTNLATSHYNEHNDRDGRIHDNSAPAEAGTEQGRVDGCTVEGADGERPDPDVHVAGMTREADVTRRNRYVVSRWRGLWRSSTVLCNLASQMDNLEM